MTRVTIIGLGLIGGSLGLALKQSGGKEWEIRGYSRRPETIRLALKQGAIDQMEVSLQGAVDKAELVVLATPIGVIPQVLAGIAPHLSKGCVVSDTCSTKEQVLEWARAALPPGIQFVGGHPMAGKETWGLEVAEPSLFREATYCIVPSSTTTTQAIRLVTEMVKAIRAKPLILSAEVHDHLVAGISHLPLIISAALVSVTQGEVSWPQMAGLAAGGYRDTTRLASGNPEMGRDICLTNHRALLFWIDRFIAELSQFRKNIELDAPKEIEAAFRQAREGREAWLKTR